MPLDDLELRTKLEQSLPDFLTAMGIVPVAKEFVAKHKADVLARVIAQYPRLRRVVRWRETRPPKQLILILLEKGLMGYSSADNSPAPAEIIGLVRDVTRRAPQDATFGIEYCYIDPIVNVYYKGPMGENRSACLGIWANGKTVAIAKRLPKGPWLDRSLAWVHALFRR
jgi:hypothetical protein